MHVGLRYSATSALWTWHDRQRAGKRRKAALNSNSSSTLLFHHPSLLPFSKSFPLPLSPGPPSFAIVIQYLSCHSTAAPDSVVQRTLRSYASPSGEPTKLSHLCLNTPYLSLSNYLQPPSSNRPFAPILIRALPGLPVSRSGPVKNKLA